MGMLVCSTSQHCIAEHCVVQLPSNAQLLLVHPLADCMYLAAASHQRGVTGYLLTMQEMEFCLPHGQKSHAPLLPPSAQHAQHPAHSPGGARCCSGASQT